jgi:tetrahydromethanopterin S-methyltransferase subunit D
MKSAIVGVLVAVGLGVVPASAQKSTAPGAKLQSETSAPAAAAARHLPTGSTQARLEGETGGGPGPAAAMAGNAGLADTKAGKSSVEKAQTQ